MSPLAMVNPAQLLLPNPVLWTSSGYSSPHGPHHTPPQLQQRPEPGGFETGGTHLGTWKGVASLLEGVCSALTP